MDSLDKGMLASQMEQSCDNEQSLNYINLPLQTTEDMFSLVLPLNDSNQFKSLNESDMNETILMESAILNDNCSNIQPNQCIEQATVIDDEAIKADAIKVNSKEFNIIDLNDDKNIDKLNISSENGQMIEDENHITIIKNCLDNIVRLSMHYQYMLHHLAKETESLANLKILPFIQKDIKICDAQQKKILTISPFLEEISNKYHKQLPSKNTKEPIYISYEGKIRKYEPIRRSTRVREKINITVEEETHLSHSSTFRKLQSKKLRKTKPLLISIANVEKVTTRIGRKGKIDENYHFDSQFKDDDDSDYDEKISSEEEDPEEEEEEEDDDVDVEEKDDRVDEIDDDNDPEFRAMSLAQKREMIDHLGFSVSNLKKSTECSPTASFKKNCGYVRVKNKKWKPKLNTTEKRKTKNTNETTAATTVDDNSQTIQLAFNASTISPSNDTTTSPLMLMVTDKRSCGVPFTSLLPSSQSLNNVTGDGQSQPSTSTNSIFELKCRAVGCRFHSDNYLEIVAHEIRAHERGYMLHCDEIGCDELFNTKTELEVHNLRFHYDKVNNFICPIDTCRCWFGKMTSLKKHCKEEHNEEYTTCTICNMRFISRARLVFHVQYVHQDQNVEVRRALLLNVGELEKSFPCRLAGCNIDFKLKIDLKRHVMYAHGVEYRTCRFCRRVCESYGKLTHHISSVHPVDGVEVVCNHKGCTFKSSSSTEMKRHRYNAHPNLVACTVEGCGMTVPRIKMSTHMARVHKEKRQMCTWPECNRAFGTSSKLKRHLRVHMRFKKYRCKWPECNYASEERVNIAMHVRFWHFKLPRTHKEQMEQGIYSDPSLNAYDWVETAPEDIKI